MTFKKSFGYLWRQFYRFSYPWHFILTCDNLPVTRYPGPARFLYSLDKGKWALKLSGIFSVLCWAAVYYVSSQIQSIKSILSLQWCLRISLKLWISLKRRKQHHPVVFAHSLTIITVHHQFHFFSASHSSCDVMLLICGVPWSILFVIQNIKSYWIHARCLPLVQETPSGNRVHRAKNPE